MFKETPWIFVVCWQNRLAVKFETGWITEITKKSQNIQSTLCPIGLWLETWDLPILWKQSVGPASDLPWTSVRRLTICLLKTKVILSGSSVRFISQWNQPSPNYLATLATFQSQTRNLFVCAALFSQKTVWICNRQEATDSKITNRYVCSSRQHGVGTID